MKKIALITTNKILAESLAASVKAMSDLKFEFFLFLNPHQALLDAEILEINIALIDLALINIVASHIEKKRSNFVIL